MASKLSQMQARFQQRQMQEKEEKMLRLYENQQQRTIERVNRGSAESTTSISSITSVTSTQGGKVRQMFDERRQKAGIDRSYPLEPLRNVNNRTVVSKTNVHVKNGQPLVNKREVVVSQYNNNNGTEYYDERRYENDNLNASGTQRPILNKTYRPRDFEILMNNNHIHDNLDDEEFPDFGIDDIDDAVAEPVKLIKESPQNGTPNHNNKIQKNVLVNGKASPVRNSITPKKEVKQTVRKTVLQAKSPLQNSSPLTSSNKKVATAIVTPPRTPEKVSSVKMSSSKTSGRTPVGSRTPSDSRTPSASRTSTKPGGGGSSSVVTRDNLEECRFCSRRFASDRLAVHEDICAKTGKKKRRTYDATKHRVQGTELEPYVKKVIKAPVNKQKPAKKTDWRRTHEEFISAIRAAKQAQEHVAKGGKLSDLPPPPPSYNPDYVQCPHCGRRFNEAAAARHIPKCASYDYNKPKPQPRPGGGSRNTFR